MTNMEYTHQVSYDDWESDSKKGVIFIRSNMRYFPDVVLQVKEAINDWVSSDDMSVRKRLIDCARANNNEYSYYDDMDFVSDEDKETLKPISEMPITWKDVAVFMPNEIEQKYGFSTYIDTFNEVNSDENLNG